MTLTSMSPTCLGMVYLYFRSATDKLRSMTAIKLTDGTVQT